MRKKRLQNISRYTSKYIYKSKVTHILIIFIFTMGSCGTENKKSKIVLAFSLPNQKKGRWERDKKEMVKMAKEQGVILLVPKHGPKNLADQLKQLQYLLNQNPDVLVIIPREATGLSSMVKKANQAGIPVISYDRLILNSKPTVYISFDNVKVGELQGEFLTKLVPRGNYIIMSGALTDENARLLKNGAMKYLQPLINNRHIHVIANETIHDWKAENALKIVKDALIESKNNVDAILAPNDRIAGAAIEVLKNQRLERRVVVTGQDANQDALKRISEGTQSMTVYKEIRLLVQKTIEVAKELAKGRKVQYNKVLNNNTIDVPTILIPPRMITKENLKSVLNKN